MVSISFNSLSPRGLLAPAYFLSPCVTFIAATNIKTLILQSPSPSHIAFSFDLFLLEMQTFVICVFWDEMEGATMRKRGKLLVFWPNPVIPPQSQGILVWQAEAVNHAEEIPFVWHNLLPFQQRQLPQRRKKNGNFENTLLLHKLLVLLIHSSCVSWHIFIKYYYEFTYFHQILLQIVMLT